MHSIRLDPVALRIDLHLWHNVIMLHVLLSDLSTILHGLNLLVQAIRFDSTVGD